jgi:serine/threonine protein phosphatase PrpC
VTMLRAAGATDTGRVRSGNQDQLLIAEPLFAVADGMGGHAGGEVASVTAIEALLVAFDGNRSADGLADAVRHANRAVWEMALERPDLRGMGTTMTALALVGEDEEEVMAIVNVGDSRAYLLRSGELDQLTDDHTVPEELVRAGRLSPEEAADDPRRHVLTRVLGVEPDVELDCFRVVPYQGDRVLLASDGLFNEVGHREIASALRRGSSPEKTAQELVRMANDRGGSDNITVVVIHVVEDDDRAGKASRALEREPIVALPHSLPTMSRQGDSNTEEGEEGEPRSRPLATAVADQPTPAPVRSPEPRPPLSSQPPRARRPRRPTVRTVLFLLALALVAGASVTAVGVYARASYYVGIRGAEVAIFKGRPGGLLWFEPTFQEGTGVQLGQVLPSRVDDLRQGKEEPSLVDARRYVSNIRAEALALNAATSPAPPAGAVTTPPPAAPPAGPAPRP